MSITQTHPEREIDDAFIGRRVHQLMWDRQVTQTELGNALGMDQSTVAKRLRGKVGWPATLLVRTAAVLQTSVAYLVGEIDGEDPAPKGSTSDYSSVVSLDNYRSQKAAAHRAVRSDHEGDAIARRVHS